MPGLLAALGPLKGSDAVGEKHPAPVEGEASLCQGCGGRSRARRGLGRMQQRWQRASSSRSLRLQRLLTVGSALCAEREVTPFGFGPTPEMKRTVPGHAVDE